MRLSLCTASFACLVASAGCGGQGLLAPVDPVTGVTTTPDTSTTTTSAPCGADPRTLATVAGTANQILLAGASVFWSTSGDTTSAIWRSEPGATGATRFADGDRLVGVDGTKVVWTANREQRLHTTEITTSVATDLEIALSDYRGSYGSLRPIVDHGQIAWSNGDVGGGAYLTMPVGGGTPTDHHLADHWVVALDWGGLADGKLWATTDGLWRGDGTTGGTLVGQPAGSIIRVTASDAYVDGPNGVVAVPLAGGSPRVLAKPFASLTDSALCKHDFGKQGVSSIVVTPDETVFVATWQDCTDGSFSHTLWRMGDAPVKLASYLTQGDDVPAALTADNQCVYWLTSDKGSGNASLWSLAAKSSKK